MTGLLSGIGIGFLVTAIAVIALAILLRRGKRSKMSVKVHGSVDQMRAIGELHVFKVVTKEIVTAKDHMFGESGTKYFEWFLSSNKMAMIFEFDIAFSYDLKDRRFKISEAEAGQYLLKMPPCRYDIHIMDIEFYDEQKSRFLPKILPEVIGNIFSTGFGEEQRNELKDEAKKQAEVLAGKMVGRLMSDVKDSAELTLRSIAKGFGVAQVSFEYEADPDGLNARAVEVGQDVLAQE